MVKGITRQVILVKSPDPKLFEEAIFIVKEEALEPAAEGVPFLQPVRPRVGGGGGRPGLRHLVRGADLAVRERRCERTGLNGRFFCAGGDRRAGKIFAGKAGQSMV